MFKRKRKLTSLKENKPTKNSFHILSKRKRTSTQVNLPDSSEIKNLLIKKFSKLKLKKSHYFIIAFSLFFIGIVFSVLKYRSMEIKYLECMVENISCVEGNIKIPDFISENFIKYNLNPVKQKILYTYPQIRSLDIRKTFPSTVKIKIKLREPIALIEDKFQNRSFIDDEGMVFSQAVDKKDPYIVIKTEESVILGEKTVSPTIHFCISLVNNLEASLLPVSEINVINPENIEVLLKNQKIVYFTSQKNVVKQVDSLQFILNNREIDENKKNIIDLRFENALLK